MELLPPWVKHTWLIVMLCYIQYWLANKDLHLINGGLIKYVKKRPKLCQKRDDIIISTRNTMESFLFPKHPASEITASEVTASKTPCKMEPGRSQMLWERSLERTRWNDSCVNVTSFRHGVGKYIITRNSGRYTPFFLGFWKHLQLFYFFFYPWLSMEPLCRVRLG